MVTYICAGVAVLAVGASAVLAGRLKTSREELREKEEALTESREQCRREEQLYRENVQAKENLNMIYEELKSRYEKVNRLAYTDSLTELPNRQQMNEMLEGIILTLRDNENMAVTTIRFVRVQGASEAPTRSVLEEVMIDLAQKLKEQLGRNDYLARTGDVSFTIISQNYGTKEELGNRLQEVFSKITGSVNCGGRDVLPIIYGATVLAPQDGKTLQLLNINLELALAEAAKQPYSNLCFYVENYAVQAMRQMELQATVRNAIRSHQLEYRFEALMDLKKGKVSGFLAEPYLEHETLGAIQYEQMKSAIEESGMASEAFVDLLQAACRQQLKWKEQGYGLIPMLVRCTNRQLFEADFVRNICNVVEESGADPTAILFLIPGSAMKEDAFTAVSVLQKLMRFGMRSILTDFGAEIFDWNLLSEVTLEGVMLAERIRSSLNPKEKQTVLQSITEIIHSFHTRLIVTGVDQKDQEVMLRQCSCDCAAGELYGGRMTENIAGQFLRINQ